MAKNQIPLCSADLHIFQSNCSLCIHRTHRLYFYVWLKCHSIPMTAGISVARRRPAEGAREWPGMGIWISEKQVGVERTIEWEEAQGERAPQWVTQLSVGVMFNWINLLWNVQVLPGLMPCVHWRLGRKVKAGGGGCWVLGELYGEATVCNEIRSEKANSPTGFDSFIPSHAVTPVLLCLNLFLRPHIQHQNTRHMSSLWATDCMEHRGNPVG